MSRVVVWSNLILHVTFCYAVELLTVVHLLSELRIFIPLQFETAGASMRI